jgi:hypothetical protein
MTPAGYVSKAGLRGVLAQPVTASIRISVRRFRIAATCGIAGRAAMPVL